jgi:hypothetical protein
MYLTIAPVFPAGASIALESSRLGAAYEAQNANNVSKELLVTFKFDLRTVPNTVAY